MIAIKKIKDSNNKMAKYKKKSHFNNCQIIYSCQLQINPHYLIQQSFDLDHMQLDEPFKKDDHVAQSSAQTSIDIEQNSSSIIYKYFHPKDGLNTTVNKAPLQPPIPLTQQLSKVGFSPNHEEATLKFAKYRSKQNIIHQFEKYIVYNKILGEGSFSKVYLGEAKKGKKLVAIKEVSKLEENEIACLMNSESPFIIKLYEFWSVEKHSYIALELCDGNLRQSLENINIFEKIEYFEQIVEGMNYLNKKNIIHRDLKFENILLKNHTVKISDFGFAKPIGSQLAVLSEKCGTPYTMAPQIFFHSGQGKPIYTHKCDIYSLGVILHQMLYNKHPYDYSIEKMRSNQRLIVNKKFGVLDVLIDRSLEQEVTRRCNWNEFMQIFSLHKRKKTNENLQVLRLKAKNPYETKDIEPKLNKKPSNPNLLQQKRPSFQTPPKNELNKQKNQYDRRQNPFHKIRLPQKENFRKKPEQKKLFPDNYQKQAPQLTLAERKLRQQAWRMEHDQYFIERKENPMQTEAISAVKLILLVVMVFGFIALLHKQFK